MQKVSSLLLAQHNSHGITRAFLFQIVRYFSNNGHRILYIAPEPITALPAAVNNSAVATDPDIMRLISFLYLPTKNELLNYLSTIHKIHRPPVAIIVEDLNKYCSMDDVSVVCGMLFTAISTCGERLTLDTTLIASIEVPVPTVVLTNFFHNVWFLNCNDKKLKLSNLNAEENSPIEFTFTISEDLSELMLKEVFKMN